MRTDSRIPDIGSRLYKSVNQRLSLCTFRHYNHVAFCWKQTTLRRRRRRRNSAFLSSTISPVSLENGESLVNGIRLIFRATVGRFTASAFERTVSAGRAAPFKRFVSCHRAIANCHVTKHAWYSLHTHTHTHTYIQARNVGTDNVHRVKGEGEKQPMINRADWPRWNDLLRPRFNDSLWIIGIDRDRYKLTGARHFFPTHSFHFDV